MPCAKARIRCGQQRKRFASCTTAPIKRCWPAERHWSSISQRAKDAQLLWAASPTGHVAPHHGGCSNFLAERSQACPGHCSTQKAYRCAAVPDYLQMCRPAWQTACFADFVEAIAALPLLNQGSFIQRLLAIRCAVGRKYAVGMCP